MLSIFVYRKKELPEKRTRIARIILGLFTLVMLSLSVFYTKAYADYVIIQENNYVFSGGGYDYESHPGAKGVPRKTNVEIQIRADNDFQNPCYSYKWYRNNSIISGANSWKYSFYSGTADPGTFKCVVYHPDGRKATWYIPTYIDFNLQGDLPNNAHLKFFSPKTGREISKIFYEDGHYFWEDGSNKDYSSLIMKVSIPGWLLQGDQYLIITLPKGFSSYSSEEDCSLLIWSDDFIDRTDLTDNIWEASVSVFLGYCDKPAGQLTFSFSKYVGGDIGYFQDRIDIPVGKHIEDTSCDLTLYDGQTEIDALTYTFGSYSWDRGLSVDDPRKDNYSSFTMKLTINDYQDSLVGSMTIKLPEGFSFEPDSIVDVKKESFGNGTHVISETVYPLYSSSIGGAVTLTGDINQTLYLPIKENNQKGVIKMRQTANVNLVNDGFTNTIEIDPITNFVKDPVNRYSQGLSEICCTLSQAVYNNNQAEYVPTYIKESFYNLGFSRFKWETAVDDHDVAVGFAQKKVISDGVIYNTLIVAVQGTVANNDVNEWIGNFNVNGDDNSVHSDFLNAANNTALRLEHYCRAFGINRANTRLILCGHSRAGAVVDLLAHALNTSNNGFRDITAYTYAAANSVRNPVQSSIDGNIFNYVYKYDIVGFVPAGDYGKYGNTFVIGGSNPSEADQAVVSAFRRNTRQLPYQNIGSGDLINGAVKAYYFWHNGMNYSATKAQSLLGWLLGKPSDLEISKKIARAHSGENYCAWVLASDVSNAIPMEYFVNSEYLKIKNIADKAMVSAFAAGSVTGAFVSTIHNPANFIKAAVTLHGDGVKLFGIKCPVDVIITDEEQTILAHYRNHTEIQTSDLLLSETDGVADYYAISTDSNYSVNITATDNGWMTIDYLYMNAENGECETVESVRNIPLNAGETYSMIVSNGCDYLVTVTSSTGVIYEPSPEIDPSLTLRIPSEVTAISEQAFYGISAETVYIPASVNSIESMAFGACPNLRRIFFENGNIEVAEDFISGCPADLVIEAPEGSIVYNNIALYFKYICPPNPPIDQPPDKPIPYD